MSAVTEKEAIKTMSVPPSSSPPSFAWQGADYRHHSEMQFDSIYTAIQAFNWDQCHAQQAILDMGCGDGKLTAEIAQRLPHGTVLGVDASSAMVSFSQAQYHSGPPNLSFEMADVQALPEKFNNRFGTITSFYCLHWVPNLAAAFNSMERCLTHKGRIFLCFCGEGEPPVLGIVENLLLKETGNTAGPTIYRRTANEVTQVAQAAGLTVDLAEEISYPYTYRDKHALAQWIAALPYGGDLPQTQRLAYINQAIDLYLQRNPHSEDKGKITLKYPLLHIRAHKK